MFNAVAQLPQLPLRALRELAAGREGRWLGTWLSYEAVVTPAPEDGALA